MSDITPPAAGDFDLTEGMFSGFEQGNAQAGIGFGAGNGSKKASRPTTDDHNLGRMRSQERKN
jgi:hypothetical protein